MRGESSTRAQSRQYLMFFTAGVRQDCTQKSPQTAPYTIGWWIPRPIMGTRVFYDGQLVMPP